MLMVPAFVFLSERRDFLHAVFDVETLGGTLAELLTAEGIDACLGLT